MAVATTARMPNAATTIHVSKKKPKKKKRR